jgi:hypothetical protein
MKLSPHFQRALAITAVAAFYYFTPGLFPIEATYLRNWTLVAFFGGMISVNIIRGIKEMQSQEKHG